MPRRKLVDAISSDSDIQLDTSVELTFDPPNNASVPHALGVYVFLRRRVRTHLLRNRGRYFSCGSYHI